MRSDLSPGGTFPDYELPDHESVPRRPIELQGDNPLILTPARGHYCPKEHQQHLELDANYPKINVAYTERVVQKDLDIHSISNGYWFWGRPSLADLWRDLRVATSPEQPAAH